MLVFLITGGFLEQAFQLLAEKLPYAKHVHSKLVCSITKEAMNEHNSPMVTPNGTVFSENAVKQYTSRDNIFTCPTTGKCSNLNYSPLDCSCPRLSLG